MNDSNDRRGKSLSRHKSMPLTIQPPLDDTFSQEKDCGILIKELRKKSVKIYELEEKCDEKDSRIYSLEMDKSKMKMTFDKLRYEMHDLKKKERDYQHLMGFAPQRSLRNAAAQTDFGSKSTTIYAYENDPRLNLNSDIRELIFNTESKTCVNQSLNQTHFSDLNNASSDNLIPSTDMSMEEIRIVNANDQAEVPETDLKQEQRKKPKKLGRFFKLVPCISKKN